MALKAEHAGYVMPIEVRRITSHQPCEGCGVKSVRYRARFDPPGKERVTFLFCDTCIDAIRQG